MFLVNSAINDSCLVYDGKLVINANFCTNDPNIRAAGPLTKYARRYHSENWTHANFNSKEVGAKLAESVLELFDPTLDVQQGGGGDGSASNGNASNESKLIPKYKEALADLCLLPGMSFITVLYCLGKLFNYKINVDFDYFTRNRFFDLF